MKPVRLRRSSLLLTLTALSGLFPTFVTAQQGALEEVVVSAQRRDTNLQQTPLSVTAFSAQELEFRNMTEGRDLTINVPNFFMGGSITNERNAQLFMRGVPGVGIYLDGVWQETTGALFANLLEVERVEVLRGPQGTLFGRNTNGGAIQYVTTRPGDEFRAEADVELGNLSRKNIALRFDAPITDNLHTKWLVAQQEQDGYIHSITAPLDFGGNDETIFRGDVLWEPSDDLMVRFVMQSVDKVTSSARYTFIHIPEHRFIKPYNVAFQNPAFRRQNGGTLPNAPFTPEAQNAAFGRVGEKENTMEIGEDGLQIESADVNLTIEWNLTDNMMLRSISGFTDIDSQTFVDFDSTNYQQFVDELFDEEENVSQELHLTGSNFDGRVNWLVGGYFLQREERDRNYRWTMIEFFEPTGSIGDFGCRRLPCPAPNQEMVDYVRAWGMENDPASCLDNDPDTNPPLSNCMSSFSPLAFFGDSLSGGKDIDRAVFGEVDFDITQRLTGTVGVRFTQGDGVEYEMEATEAFRSFEIRDIEGDPLAGSIVAAEHEPELPTIRTPRISFSYQFDNDRMLYASYAEGFTSGEINFVELLGNVVLKPEVVRTREIGLRSDWLDGRLRYNGTYFDSKWTGLRVNNLVRDPETGQVLPFPFETSSGVAEVSGTEHEILYAPSPLWRLNLTLATLDTQYLNIGDPEVSPLSLGDEFGYASDLSYSLGLQRMFTFSSGGQLTLNANYGWKDEYQKDSAPRRQTPQPEPAYGLFNARLTYQMPGRPWRVSLWGKNLADITYDSGGINADATGVNFLTMGRPKEYGLTLNMEFR